MRLEHSIGVVFSAALASSATMALVRSREELGRRRGHKGTSLISDGKGRWIEYSLTGAVGDEQSPIILCENGLGSPLESWDWVQESMSTNCRILRYHRRGYCRSTTHARPAQNLELLLEKLAPSGPIHLLAHSLGVLVAGNLLRESAEIRRRVASLSLIDGTDADLLSQHRRNPAAIGLYRQMSAQEALSSVTGMSRWTMSKIERDVDYRPDIQRAFIQSSGSPRTLIAAQREYLGEPLQGQLRLTALPIPTRVYSASDNTEQQGELARKLGADFSVVKGSSHRGTIGQRACAEWICKMVWRDIQ